MRILRTARQVFARQGYAATRMIDVATEAQVGKGTLYEHFQSKEDLFANLVVEVATESLEALTSRTLSQHPERALRETIAYLVEVALAQNLDLYGLFFDFWGTNAGRGEARRRLREIDGRFRGFFAGLVRAGQRAGVFHGDIEPERVATALSAAVDGLSLRLVILGEQIDLKEYAAYLQRLFVDGLLAGGALGGASVLKEKSE